ncbi:Protein of unknown function [Gryllus bimaculatus]|nr:Protein of unknown function [Gryllus bimaculatus]
MLMVIRGCAYGIRSRGEVWEFGDGRRTWLPSASNRTPWRHWGSEKQLTSCDILHSFTVGIEVFHFCLG